MENNDPGEKAAHVITDTVPVAAVRCDREGRFLWVNQTYARWAGRTPRELIGRRIIDIVGSRAMREVQPFIDRVLEGEPVSYERVVELPGLGRHWVKWAYTPTHETAGLVGDFASPTTSPALRCSTSLAISLRSFASTCATARSLA